VRVQVSATPTEALVRVIDRGAGVPPGEHERIFEPFYRVAPGRVPRGAGLGLAIARGFAEANGGRVWVESCAAPGASFVLSLPIAAEAGADLPSPRLAFEPRDSLPAIEKRLTFS
jgi:two-component system, OmpR family, sensor histidine kinase KdpD